jgi:nitrite reductase/ring-hydroxylating ferredoxin subunit
MIRCRWHNYVFRLNDGKAVNCPGFRLKVFEVKREGGALMARAVK